MSKTDDGGPAFARPPAWSPGYQPEVTKGQRGMTLRDYFAAKVLPQIALAYCDCDSKHAEVCADHAYRFADAMLEARKQER